jgi:hypothetical protein
MKANSQIPGARYNQAADIVLLGADVVVAGP